MDIPSTSSGDANYQQWSQVIECPICYTIYDKPMQMGCGHTLCSTCVGKLVEQAKNNQIEEMRFPHIARMQMNIEDGIIGLGGGPDAFDDQQWIEMPHLDQREPMLRGFIGFPGAPPGRRRDANPNGSTEIKCPECRKPTIVPADGLPVNYRVQEIVGKVAPLFKDRHLVKYCNQCEEVLAGGVYFDCSDCQEKNRKICSTCAIRTHNGHKLVEKKALTSDDVRQMKQKINDVSARAFQALEGIKNTLAPVGGTIESKVIDKLSGFIKVFEFMNTSFDSKIKETSTVDELMMDVQKAEQVANLYERSQDRVQDMLNSIEAAVVTYWQPFDQLRQDLNFEMEDGIVAPAAPAAPTPAPVAAPPPVPPQLMDQLNDIPAAAMRALRRPVGQHNLQVERMRLRNRNLFPAPPMQHQPPPQQQLPPPQQHPQQQAPRGNNGHNGPPPPQINFPVWQPAPQMGHAMGPHINMMRGPPRMMQQQQGPPPQAPPPPPPPIGNLDLLEILQVRQQGPMPQPMRLNAQNLHQMAHQHNQNVPMPPQMPNFHMQPAPAPQHPQQQMHMRQQQMMQNAQMMRMPPPPPPPPQFQGQPPPGNRPMQQYMQIMPQQPQQQQQQPQQMQQMPPQMQQNLQQNLQQIFQQPPMQQPIVHQIQLQAPLQPPPQQQLQQPPIQEQPVPDDLPPPNEPVWNNEPPMGFGQPPMGFEGQPEEGEEEEEEDPIQQPDPGVMAPPPEDYAPPGALDMLRFQEVGDVMHLGPQLMNNDINGVEADLIVEADDVDDQDQFEEAVEEFGEFQEMQQAVDRILPVLVPEEIVLNNDDVVVPPELNAPVLVDQGIQEVPEVVEEEDADEEEEEVYENPRRGGAPQDNTRRNTRRSVRSSAEEGPSTSSGNRSTSPSTSQKRRRVERKPKSEEPEPMEEDEPVDTVHRPPKRRAATSSSSGASSSGASTSSAPTTRSQTRS
ncbi:hypothetical protein B9Z55_017013 [Caenorhabditis nigoni]|nr:hypothetical protein B9Z55_017013 [Caenorhabditis nigoni]